MDGATLELAGALGRISLYLPLFGLGVLVAALLALTLRREQWLLPGTIAAAFFSLSAYGFLEYQDRLHDLMQKQPPPAVAVSVPAPPAPAAEPEPPAPV